MAKGERMEVKGRDRRGGKRGNHSSVHSFLVLILPCARRYIRHSTAMGYTHYSRNLRLS